MAELLYRDLTEKIIRTYYDVYNGLSRTYPEFIYENAMMQDLQRNQIECTRQDEYQIYYKEWLVGVQRLDIFVAEEVVVELKVKPRLTPLDQAQTISYLKTTEQQVGLLFNFGDIEPEFDRLFFTGRSSQPLSFVPQKEWPDLLFPETTYQIIAGLFEVHSHLGPGFIHRIYANACYREMQAHGLEVRPSRQIIVFYLTLEEQTELLGFVRQVECQDLARVEALAALAQKRGLTISAIMGELGIKEDE